jgi:hypothetical protein
MLILIITIALYNIHTYTTIMSEQDYQRREALKALHKKYEKGVLGPKYSVDPLSNKTTINLNLSPAHFIEIVRQKAAEYGIELDSDEILQMYAGGDLESKEQIDSLLLEIDKEQRGLVTLNDSKGRPLRLFKQQPDRTYKQVKNNAPPVFEPEPGVFVVDDEDSSNPVIAGVSKSNPHSNPVPERYRQDLEALARGLKPITPSGPEEIVEGEVSEL